MIYRFANCGKKQSLPSLLLSTIQRSPLTVSIQTPTQRTPPLPTTLSTTTAKTQIITRSSSSSSRSSPSSGYNRMSSTTANVEHKPPVPPFTQETAIIKARLAEDAWNSQDPDKVKMAYTVDSIWRNRDKFLKGREEIKNFLNDKWINEQEYRLIKEVWCYNNNRIAVRFAYEYYNMNKKQWYRAYGNENWEFNEHGLMLYRHASINDVAINEQDRKFHWPMGKRPEDHPGLSDLGL